jgi:cardiolipin synthase
MWFLAAGIAVARTSNDLVRYHGKMMVIDVKQLYLLTFTLTRLDIDHSRSFGIVTGYRQLVQEATNSSRRTRSDNLPRQAPPGFWSVL